MSWWGSHEVKFFLLSVDHVVDNVVDDHDDDYDDDDSDDDDDLRKCQYLHCLLMLTLDSCMAIVLDYS